MYIYTVYIVKKKKKKKRFCFEITLTYRLSDIESTPQLILCNTDPSTKKRQHWILFYFYDGHKFNFYNSLEKPLESYESEFVDFAHCFATNIFSANY